MTYYINVQAVTVVAGLEIYDDRNFVKNNNDIHMNNDDDTQTNTYIYINFLTVYKLIATKI